jgi:hypothetical protein
MTSIASIGQEPMATEARGAGNRDAAATQVDFSAIMALLLGQLNLAIPSQDNAASDTGLSPLASPEAPSPGMPGPATGAVPQAPAMVSDPSEAEPMTAATPPPTGSTASPQQPLATVRQSKGPGATSAERSVQGAAEPTRMAESQPSTLPPQDNLRPAAPAGRPTAPGAQGLSFRGSSSDSPPATASEPTLLPPSIGSRSSVEDKTDRFPPGLERAATLWSEHADQGKRPLDNLPAAPLRETWTAPAGPETPRQQSDPASADGKGNGQGSNPTPVFGSVGLRADLPPPVPADKPHSPPTNLSELAAQLVRRASLLTVGDSAVFSLHLEPPGLGRLRVRISLARDGLTVEMNPTTQHGQQAIGASVAELHGALTARGLTVSSLTVIPEASGWGLGAYTQDSNPGQPQLPAAPSASPRRSDHEVSQETTEPTLPKGRIDLRI